jgi:hypothetical protein
MGQARGQAPCKEYNTYPTISRMVPGTNPIRTSRSFNTKYPHSGSMSMCLNKILTYVGMKISNLPNHLIYTSLTRTVGNCGKRDTNYGGMDNQWTLESLQRKIEGLEWKMVDLNLKENMNNLHQTTNQRETKVLQHKII